MGAADGLALWRRAYCGEDDSRVCYGTRLVGEGASLKQMVKVYHSAFLASQLDRLLARAGCWYEAVAVCIAALPLGVDILDLLRRFRVLRAC